MFLVLKSCSKNSVVLHIWRRLSLDRNFSIRIPGFYSFYYSRKNRRSRSHGNPGDKGLSLKVESGPIRSRKWAFCQKWARHPVDSSWWGSNFYITVRLWWNTNTGAFCVVAIYWIPDSAAGADSFQIDVFEFDSYVDCDWNVKLMLISWTIDLEIKHKKQSL